jgi:proteic killer suppression protein
MIQYMEILFKNKGFARTFNSQKELCKAYGTDNGKVIMHRMAVLSAAPNLAKVSDLPPEKRHELKGGRKGAFAVWLKHPFRLVFEPYHNPLPKMPDGGLDLDRISSIMMLSVEDYH